MYSRIEVKEKQQLIDLILLWKEVFRDSTEYVKNFYKYFYHDMDIIALCNESRKIVSACHFIPTTMKLRGIACNGTYLYAAMTQESHRGKGLMREIVKTKLQQAHAAGDSFMCTLPSEDSLYSYYEELGFSQIFNLDVVKLSRNHLSKVKLTLAFDSKLSPEFAYRKSFGSKEYTVIKNKRFVDYTELEYRSSGGVFIPIYGGYLYVKEEENKIFIEEAFITNENLPYIASVLLRTFPKAEEFIFNICPKSAFANHPSKTIKYGCARIVNAEAILKLFALKNPTKILTINLLDEFLPLNTGLYTLNCGKVVREEFSDELEATPVSELAKVIFTNFGEVIPYMNMMLN